jgi:outer membrane protein TolC
MEPMNGRWLMIVTVLGGSLGGMRFAVAEGDGEEHRSQVTFQHVLDLTLKNSFKIALAQEQVESSFRALRFAKRRRTPRASIQGWFSGDLFETDSWGSDNFGSYLALDWDFYQNGAIMQMIAQSWANLMSALWTGRRTVGEEIYNATSLFYDALKAKRQVEIAGLILDLDRRQLQVVRSAYEQGNMTRLELLDAETKASDSELAQARAQQDFEKTLRSLRHLTQESTITGVEDLPREITWTPDFPVADAIRTSLDHQPNVKIAEANLEMAQLGVKYSKLKRWPSVRFLTGTDYALASLNQPDELGFRVGVLLSYPLYDAGDRRSQIEDAKSALVLAEIQLRQAQYQMEQEVTDDYMDVSNKLELLRIAENRHEKVKTDFTIAQQQFERGDIDELELARIRLLYVQSLQRIESMKLDTLLARAKLLKSVGVGSTERIKDYAGKGVGEKK